MTLIEIGNFLLHMVPGLAALLYKLRVIPEGLHDMFCTYGCDVPEFAW